jgi:hypothetical protein
MAEQNHVAVVVVCTQYTAATKTYAAAYKHSVCVPSASVLNILYASTHTDRTMTQQRT